MGTPARRALGLLFAVLGVSAAALIAAESTVPVEDWSRHAVGTSGVPNGWSTYGRSAKYTHPPSIALDDGRKALWLRTDHYSVRLARKVDVDLKRTPVLTWEWKAVVLPEHGNLRGEINDQVARVVVIFRPFLRPIMIGYVWDTSAPVGATLVKSSWEMDRRLLVIRSGRDGLGKWVTETRDVHADYVRLFSAEPSTVKGIGLESHSEDAAHKSEVFIGPIVVRSH